MKSRGPVSRSGRFQAGPAQLLLDYTESVSFDWRLWRQDIRGSIAHATMLGQVGLITKTECRSIVKGLRAIAREIEEGRFRWKKDLEDVHMNIEAELTRRAPAGAKLHTGRSRNDQVAVDLRLWVKDDIGALDGEVRELQAALLSFGEAGADLVIPGYTHLQRAQPVLFAHHLLAYVEMLERDRERLAGCWDRANVCPLGCGAIAGTTLPLDRELTARLLGFVDLRGRARICENSMDAVSDRDFAAEYAAVLALLAVHLSRFAEDLVLWSTAEFAFVRLPDAFTTGSSLMPQKKNPDVAELARGKAGRVIGDLMALLTLLKGLPMTYNRDLQEDKERLFDASDTVRATVRIFSPMLKSTQFHRAACAAAVADAGLLATDLVDQLVLRGIPFRSAHHLVGACVAAAEEQGVSLRDLPAAEYRRFHPALAEAARESFDLAKAMQRRDLPGAPGFRQVRRQLGRWNQRLAKERRQRSYPR